MTVQPPPMPRSKRRNSVLRLYDGPLYRDWAFWLTTGNVLLGVISIATSDTPSTTPVWFDSILGAVMCGGLFGVVPAWLRLWIRRWRWRRSQHRAQTIASAHSGSFQQPSTHPFPMQWAGPANWRERTAMPASTPPPYQPARHAPVPPPANRNQPPTERIVEPRPPVSVTPPHPASNELAIARKSLQHPIARSVRVLQQAHTARDQYDAVLDTAEALAITISLTAAAVLKDQVSKPDGVLSDPANRALAALRTAYTGAGTTFGTWTTWLGNLRPLVDDSPTLIPGLSSALHTHPGNPSVIDDLNALRAERNHAAHGGRPHTMQEYAVRVAHMMPRIENALRRSRFLEDSPWLLTVSSSFQPRPRVFDVRTQRVMGDHPHFETQNFLWREPVADDMFYVLGSGGPVMMSPFVASRFCTHCHQVEVCYAYRTNRHDGPATFKSFDSGHDIGVEELGDDLRALPERQRDR
ncbi:hypothetical protein AB0E63_13080 [Kribbella sp. NPDC026596]|uniref:hypothetical protein n=1 Tax=Kribbella sp. NPDC026596 TaxID=3155122 RepID=UPI0033F884A8